MKLKVFQIRQTEENLKSDEETVCNFLECVTVIKTATQFVTDKINYWSILVFYEEKKKEASDPSKSSKIAFPINTTLNDEEYKKYRKLKKWRYDKAAELELPQFLICSNVELLSIVKAGVESLEQLYSIKGFGPQKVNKFGSDLVGVLNAGKEHCAEEIISE
jgi:superfamily II DNA helicase RecQ